MPASDEQEPTSDDEIERTSNEALFREANEQISRAARDLDPPLERIPVLCECDDASCRELIQMTVEEYEKIRSDATRFAIVRGPSSIGVVVEEHESYLVVRKSGEAGELAAALDPREGEA